MPHRIVSWTLGLTLTCCSLACGPLEELELASSRVASTGSDLLPGTKAAEVSPNNGSDLISGTPTNPAQTGEDHYIGAGPAVSDCSPRQTSLTIAGGLQAGRVSVTNDEKNLIVDVRAQNRYQILSVQIYAGAGKAPASVELFPVKQTHAAPVNSTSVAVPLSKLSAHCGRQLTMAIHVELVYLGSEVIVTASGWAEGPTPLSKSSPGWSFEQTICCPPEEAQP
jgi:hypothetical protein